MLVQYELQPVEPRSPDHSDYFFALDHINASGPTRIAAASSANIASHAVGLVGPPAASSAMPAPHAPRAERPKPTVECNPKVAPRCIGVALALVPEVSAPESPGTVRPYKRTNGSNSDGD